MPIDAVNSAMTPLQFARMRSQVRTVETSAALSSGSAGVRGAGLGRPAQTSVQAIASHRMIPPATFHWGYRLARVNGKPVAKRSPQFADASYWSVAINRVG
jgi:hypothetical protein